MTDIHFEWDEVKNRSNQQKHDGVSFELASQVFRDPLHISVQDRMESGEYKWQTVGLVGGHMLFLVAHTTSEDDALGGVVEIIRIISARRATTRERKRYENKIG